MIKKVLIVEDHESVNISLQKTLEEGGLIQDAVTYCDDALAKIRKAIKDGQPYDLLVADLYFDKDHRTQQLAGGHALIAAARETQPDLKVLVFSAEKRPDIVDALFTDYNIDGYVLKARNDARELKTAIERIDTNDRYLPWWFVNLKKHKNAYDFEPIDIAIITLLAQGVRQKDMPAHLRNRKLRASGLSSIEKRLNRMKEALNFPNNEMLVAYCKDLGIV